MTSLLENSIVAGKTENYLIKKLIMPSSIFTRCLLFKEISEFCLNPVWSIEISFRIAANFPPSHQIRPTADLLRFPLHCPDHPLLCHLQHPKVSRGASSSPWEGKYCSRYLHSLQTMKTLPQAKRHELSLQVNFGTIFTCLTTFAFFFYFNFFDYSCTSWKFDPVPPSPPLSSVNKTFCGSTCTSWKFGHRMAPLTLIENLGTIARFTSIKS